MTSPLSPSSSASRSPDEPITDAPAGAIQQFTLFLVPVGRTLFALLFVMASAGHFSPETVAYAASKGVPFASALVPLSGILALVGGLSVALGYFARVGATLLAVFLIPVTLKMHAFWLAVDPAARQLDQIMFMKNLALFGASLILIHCGAGPISIDARSKDGYR